jgi:hypothetical protein
MLALVARLRGDREADDLLAVKPPPLKPANGSRSATAGAEDPHPARHTETGQ